MSVRHALAVAALALAMIASADDAPPDVRDALDRVKAQATLTLTTIGRKTGKEHLKPIWFVVDDGHLVVQAGRNGKTDWYLNLLKTPTATARIADQTFRVRAVPVRDKARVEAIHRLFLKKYTSAWLLSFVGSSIGRGLPVELVPEPLTAGR